jgi:hypothetical protein
MTENDPRADELERELNAMQKRSERLEAEIGETREDWERKKRDDKVPGAGGAPQQAESDPGPETDYPAKGG